MDNFKKMLEDVLRTHSLTESNLFKPILSFLFVKKQKGKITWNLNFSKAQSGAELEASMENWLIDKFGFGSFEGVEAPLMVTINETDRTFKSWILTLSGNQKILNAAENTLSKLFGNPK